MYGRFLSAAVEDHAQGPDGCFLSAEVPSQARLAHLVLQGR